MIREMQASDGSEIISIYQLGIETRIATFEKNAPDWTTWNQRHLEHSRFVFEEEDSIFGWVALSPISVREAYKGVAEISIYVHPDFWGKGIGNQLMATAIESSEKHGIWTLVASIFADNLASIHLHIKNGFREVGYRERIAQADGMWKNTILFERRSKIVGI